MSRRFTMTGCGSTGMDQQSPLWSIPTDILKNTFSTLKKVPELFLDLFARDGECPVPVKHNA
jgi:hypothetical protein